MNNLTSLFKEAVLITNDCGLYHGIAYSNNKYMDSTSTVTIPFQKNCESFTSVAKRDGITSNQDFKIMCLKKYKCALQ